MLVNELLNLARIEEGVTQEERSETDILELIREVARTLESKSKELKMPIDASG